MNLMLGNAALRFDSAATSAQQLVEVVRATGYDAGLPDPSQTAQQAQAELAIMQEHEYQQLRRKAITSGVAGAAAMVLSMPLMGVDGHAHGGVDPFMTWAMGALTPALRSVLPWLYEIPVALLSWTLLLVTVGVMLWAGRHFYTRAWTAFRHHGADMNTLVAVTGGGCLYRQWQPCTRGVPSRGFAAIVYTKR